MLNFIKGLLNISFKSDVRILMYHQIMPENEREKNDIIISVEKLEEQLIYIKKNFETLFFKDLNEKKEVKNKLILTFDDGYFNNYKYLIPLLEKYDLKATICIPTQLIEKDLENHPGTYMNFEQIRSLPSNHFEIALHSHSHSNYSQMSIEDAEKDLTENIRKLQEEKISFTKILVYPYGKYPKRGTDKKIFFQILEKHQIIAALRIGNNIADYPWKNKFEVKRIGINGSDSFSTFKYKLRFGKIKP